jgi:2-phospho-L-lactate guanylyltransferase (CobY/MobA/RfbA family)
MTAAEARDSIRHHENECIIKCINDAINNAVTNFKSEVDIESDLPAALQKDVEEYLDKGKFKNIKVTSWNAPQPVTPCLVLKFSW